MREGRARKKGSVDVVGAGMTLLPETLQPLETNKTGKGERKDRWRKKEQERRRKKKKKNSG